ncbi:hypothetical protein BUALT_Bualt17G0025800 [Buddleja alternifolia]|uniref:Myb-like domain-containing protein n=1 Tax=Buddleja alternifolia TaxID=168488 RepID=A0AAV6WG36_9LAMI|nr:hypothetical protein BUALT_Bualt17G0025800 [Buddleja alternifolia]
MTALMRGGSGLRMNRMRGGVTNESTAKTCRRYWTPEEEKALEKAMRDLVMKGYKAERLQKWISKSP